MAYRIPSLPSPLPPPQEMGKTTGLKIRIYYVGPIASQPPPDPDWICLLHAYMIQLYMGCYIGTYSK